MSLFSKKRSFGIDFGTASIKAIELELRGGKPYLTNYGEAVLLTPEGGTGVPIRSFKEDVTLRFRALLNRMNPETKKVCLSMPSFLGLVSLIDFPEMSDTELEEAIQFEAHKYIPSPLEEVALSWEKVGLKDVPLPDGLGTQRKIEILLVAALNKDVWQYEGYAKSAECSIRLLELETFSIARAMVGNDPGTFLIIDIGARAANLILVEDGNVKMSRNIDAGGRDITRTLAESLNISLDRAETLKKSNKDFLNTRETSVIFPAIDMITNEATRMSEVWRLKYSSARIDSVILSGGTARLTGLREHISAKVGLPVSIGDPWRNIGYDKEIAEKVKEMDASFTVSLGLALYGLSTEE